MRNFSQVAGSSLASSINGWRGTLVLKAAKPPSPLLLLYDREADAQCRAVREVLTALGLDARIRPCPIGGDRFSHDTEEATEGQRIPLLIDDASGQRIGGAAAIIRHLFETYAEMPVPLIYRAGLLQARWPDLASRARLGRGARARPSRAPLQPLSLWSFESSPFSRLVRERLCELELPYTLHNLGKEHWSELGPASRRLRPGPYEPAPGGKRHEFWLQHGRVQLPYLVDPNHQVGLFESAEIIDYLESRYAL
ncbi:MAG: glutathione S-transferase N-terminal domain-containing protein [Xanthomonadales bacterium]|nr:glutathione S-transferase N-terminal domain-containing protein [Xanthomonadales bacterium]